MTDRKPKALLSWSSGKDSAFSLHELRRAGDVDVVALLTTVNEVHERVAMHAVRRRLLAEQADAADIELWEAPIPSPCSNDEYAAAMRRVVARAVAAGIEHVAFGDLYLEDIRAYREKQLRDTGLSPLFPLWQRPTDRLARDMLEAGVVAHVTAVDPKQIPNDFCGRTWDATFLDDLPDSADPCGENGEFHTFVSDGPMFARPVRVTTGDVVERDGFVFADLLPADSSAS